MKYHTIRRTPSFLGPISLNALGDRSGQMKTESVSISHTTKHRVESKGWKEKSAEEEEDRRRQKRKDPPILLDPEHDTHSSHTLAVTVFPLEVFLMWIHLLQFPL